MKIQNIYLLALMQFKTIAIRQSQNGADVTITLQHLSRCIIPIIAIIYGSKMSDNEGTFPDYITTSAIFYLVGIIADFVFLASEIKSEFMIILYYMSYKIFINGYMILSIASIAIFIIDYHIIENYDLQERIFSMMWVMYSLIEGIPSIIGSIISNIPIFSITVV